MNKTVRHILEADATLLRVLLASAAFILAMGLLFADTLSGPYRQLLHKAPAQVWAAVFLLYACLKIVLIEYPAPRYIVYGAVFLGAYLWLAVFISFLNNPERATGAADMMILVLVLCEVWVGATTLSKGRFDV